MKKIVRAGVALLLSAALLSGCSAQLRLGNLDSSTTSSSVEVTKTTSEKFDEFCDEMFKEGLSESILDTHFRLVHPENYDIKDVPVTLGEYGVDETAWDEVDETLEGLREFSYDELTPQQQIMYDIIEYDYELLYDAKGMEYYGESLGSTIGVQAQLPVTLVEYTFRERQDIEDYFVLLQDVKRYYEDILAYEKKKSEKGLFMSDTMADGIIEQCKSFIKNPDENFMITTFENRLDKVEGLTAKEKAEYQKTNEKLVKEDIVGAYETLIAGLEQLKGTGKNEGGLCGLPKGREYYQYLMTQSTGSSRTVEEMKDLLRDIIVSASNEVQLVKVKDPKAFEKFDAYRPSMTDPTEILNDLKEKIKEDFPSLPDTVFTIKKVDKAMQEHLSPAFYFSPPLDDWKNNVIYINEGSSNMGNEFYSTLAHEGYPGHLFQTVYSQSCGLPLLRNLFYFKGFSEGWATYVEIDYAYGYSDRSAPVAKLAAANRKLTLATYGLMDIGVNYEGWGKEELKEFIKQAWGSDSDEFVDAVYAQMIEQPANTLSYIGGYGEFETLKELAQDMLGKDFVLKEFHEFLMEMGEAPFALVKKYMMIWAAERTEQKDTPKAGTGESLTAA